MYTHYSYSFLPKFAVIGFALITEVLLLAGCEPCNQRGMTISAETKQTSITVPPGGGGKSLIRVRGSHFTPNAPITLFFRNYPAINSDFQEFTVADGSGTFNWEKDLFQLPQRNFTSDPNVDVEIKAKETNGGCLSVTTIKTSAILNPPF